jgi:hypothetical protein
MFNRILVYGSVAGLVVGIPLFGLTVASGGNGPPGGLLLGYTIMLVALSAVFAGVKRYRDIDRGGVVGFLPALGLGLGISMVASLFYVMAWEAAIAYAHIDFGGFYAKYLVHHAKTHGVTGAALAKVIADAEAFRRNYADPLYRMTESFTEIFPVGVLVSLISAGLLSNRRFLAVKRG